MILLYCKCGAKTTHRRFIKEGWIKAEIKRTDGYRWTVYSCAKCRAETLNDWSLENRKSENNQP